MRRRSVEEEVRYNQGTNHYYPVNWMCVLDVVDETIHKVRRRTSHDGLKYGRSRLAVQAGRLR